MTYRFSAIAAAIGASRIQLGSSRTPKSAFFHRRSLFLEPAGLDELVECKIEDLEREDQVRGLFGVAAGERVRADAVLVVLEAMKMEHSIRAPADAAIAAVHCAVGDRVDEGVELVSLESD